MVTHDDSLTSPERVVELLDAAGFSTKREGRH